ncbi:Dbl (DH) domain [Trinorchestia longiramus]|nr:Dbl (DH) domain [Trinorchestia longiramus]
MNTALIAGFFGFRLCFGVYGSSVESTSHMPSAPNSPQPVGLPCTNATTHSATAVTTNHHNIDHHHNNNNVLRNSSNVSSVSASSNLTDFTGTSRSKTSTDSSINFNITKSNKSNSNSSVNINKTHSNKSSSSNSSSDGSLSSHDKSGGRRWASLSDVAEDPVLAEAQHLTMCRCITASILESETVYLECLQVVLQYMKALKATLTTSQPVISPDDFSTVFYRIPELYNAHKEFLNGLKEHSSQHDQPSCSIGNLFLALAQKLEVYGQFLSNYSRAVETVLRCSSESIQFAAISRSIKLKSLHGQEHTLEELLHRPVARVQKNTLVLHDLLKHTPEQDSESLQEALRLFQSFLSDSSLVPSDTMLSVCDRPQRHLVRNSFIVELVDGHRKLRHLFLFNDVLLCAKYKATNRADKFTFDLKWFISLHDILIVAGSSQEQFKEANPPNLVSLKSQAATVRDQLRRLEGSSEKPSGVGGGTQSSGGGGLLHNSRVDKLRKRLSELEAQLILASPSLPWWVGRRGLSNLHNVFLLSSQYERQQWTEAVNVLQNNSPGVGGSSLTAQELQGWITAYRSFLKTNMGNFLLRSGRDEPLLLGDLHLLVKSLHGLAEPASMYLCFEVDSYGHFFRKAKTRTVEGQQQPVWDQDFIIELEGSQTLRVLCYEETQKDGDKLRGKAELDLSTSWLSESLQDRTLSLVPELQVSLQLKYLAPEATLRRVPTAKPHGLFGAPIAAVTKREKRSVPFVVTRCVREVERRGVGELGIYRVSGMSSDITRLKKSFETNPYEAEQLIKEVDIHSVTGLLKLYLRELPEALFTSKLYPNFFEAFNTKDRELKRSSLLYLFSELPMVNQSIIVYLLEHLVKVNQLESVNKMTLHNLATVFGPTVVRPAAPESTSDPAQLLAAGTVDVMAQAGILHFFLDRRARGEPIQTCGAKDGPE